MKYLELVKSFLLFFLVLLSLTFTLMIWNFKPNLKVVETAPSEEVTISPRINIDETLKAYRVVAHMEDSYKGSVANSYTNSFYKYLQSSVATDLALVNTSLTNEQITELMNINNRFMLFYGTEIPIQSFTKVLPFENYELPDMSFNRLIIDWNDLSKDKELNILFLNTNKGTLYRSSIQNQNVASIKEKFIEPLSDFTDYIAYEMPNKLALYTTSNLVESVKYMYYINDLSTEQFKRALFQSTNIVQKTQESIFVEKYWDDASIMTIDTKSRILNYVHPSSESVVDIAPNNLLLYSFQYVNDHGGFNGDYRVMGINRDKHVVDYQMFYQGFPVFSSETATKITTTWGNEQVYKYRRPFYGLEFDIPGEMSIVEVPAGKVMLDYYLKDKEIDDIVLGYNLIQNTKLSVFELVPAWFFLKDNVWERLKIEEMGGMTIGLE